MFRRKQKDGSPGSSPQPSMEARKTSSSTYDTSLAPSLDQRVRILSHPNQFPVYYDQGPSLGVGAFAKVFLGRHKATSAGYAIKKIDRAKMIWGERDALADEVNSLMAVRHGPYIVQLYEVYEEKHYCYLVTELMKGGELFERILEQKVLTEADARVCTTCILKALEYMHENRVAHRDLKPENLLLIEKDGLELKLADFGFAKKVKVHNGLRTLCGTPGYLAPEILERWPAYDTKCDLWSVGVILFLMLGGYLPFEDDDEDKVFERTRNGEYDFHPAYWKPISQPAKNLITKFLTINPNRRYSATEALKHEWFKMKPEETMPDVKAKVKAASRSQQKENTAPKTKKAIAAAPTDPHKMQKLNEDFAGYLERSKDTDKSRLVSQAAQSKKSTKRFEEDSKSGKPFATFYEVGDLLGEGGYASVFRATHKKTKFVYAVKDVQTGSLEKNSKNALRDEIAALKLLRSGPHIIRLIDVFEEPSRTYMIMEEMKGGDLLTRITEKEVYTEREARKTCKILFQAMDYIHKKKVAHRDIKPENVLMVNLDDDHSIKICDFGFAKRVPRPRCLKTLCGTAQYVAPEVLDLQSSGYDQRADMWSVGVVVYILLGGYAPFEGPVQELAQAICKADYCFHDRYWSEISEAAKSMISNLLLINFSKRLTAEEALQCPWMIVEEETLTTKDLSGAQAAMKDRKQGEATDAIRTLNKHESLDVSFTAALGTFEEVASRKAKRTSMGHALKPVDEESSVVEDSTSGKPFESIYQWGQLLEEGFFSVTHEAFHQQSKLPCAVKRAMRTDLDEASAVALQDEISALQIVADCPYVLKLYDVFDEPDATFIVMERLKGGSIIDRINERTCYSEPDAKAVVERVLMALEYCHNRRIAVRNLKCENLILTSRGSYVDVKISDFGFAKRVLYPNSLVTQCGTEGYTAPEILEHRPAYDVQCDMWSLGVVTYLLLGGYRPFRGDSNEIMRQIRYGEYKFNKRYWSEISEEAKILISRMLTVNPIVRITATAALQSDWLMMDSSSEADSSEEEEMSDIDSNHKHRSRLPATRASA